LEFAADHGGSPTEGLRIRGGDGTFREAELVLDLFATAPVAGFEAADEVQGASADTGVAGEGRFHGGVDGEVFEDAIERGFEEDVEERKDAEKIELGGLGGKRGGEELAELRAGCAESTPAIATVTILRTASSPTMSRASRMVETMPG
jgi:hypothetical protein